MKNAILTSLILLLLAGCTERKNEATTTDRRIKVGVAKAILMNGDASLKFSGTIEAEQSIPLTFQTAGIVRNVYVDVGDEVRKGQVLASIDNTDMKNIYATMEAKYKQARDAYDRLKMVHDEGSLPEIKWVEMQSNLDQAGAALELARNNLGKCDLVAPDGGIVGRRNIEPGQSSISLASAPIELVKIENVLVKISVPENEINQVRKGQKTLITVMAVNGNAVEGSITHISPVADMISRTYPVKITVDNKDLKLKPGMVCDVSIFNDNRAAILTVPYQAVTKDDAGQPYVYTVNTGSGTVHKQPVEVGNYHESGIEIISGLTEGQPVVVSGIEKLSENSSIVY